MGDIVFTLDDQGPTSLASTGFAREAELQRLVEARPGLLSEAISTPSHSIRLLLIASEAGLTDRVDGGQRYSVDSLFIDQDAVPTLVEVKRAENRELRRYVFGQMFDYAANAVRFWSADDLEAAAEVTHGEHLDALVGAHTVLAADAFWSLAQENLRQGRIRLLFVADEIPIELQTIVEFANETARETEILAVEIRKYVGSGSTVLVPRVIGRTSMARHRRDKQGEGFQELFTGLSPDLQRTVRRLRDWATENDLTESETDRGLRLALGRVHLMYVQPGGGLIQFTFKDIREQNPTMAEALMATLESLNSRGTPLATKHPQLRLADARDHWAVFRDEFLPAYLIARLRHAGTPPQ